VLFSHHTTTPKGADQVAIMHCPRSAAAGANHRRGKRALLKPSLKPSKSGR
jgi:hypothetical protein